MTNYKTGDKVLVEAEIIEQDHRGFSVSITRIRSDSVNSTYQIHRLAKENIRPYTPRQEFEYGEEVEVSDNGCKWNKAIFIGISHKTQNAFKYIVNVINMGEEVFAATGWIKCRKPKPRETITIGGVDYYKDDVEKALKDLKPVEGK